MSKRAYAWGTLLISGIALGAVDIAEAGNTPPSPTGPTVHVVVPHDASGNQLEPDDLPGPQLEVAKGAVKVDVPAVTGFEPPATEPGFHGPRELRIHGKAVLGSEVKVKGYVTSIYDCAAELASANPRAPRTQIASAIEKDASLCERPMVFLGDARTTSRDASIWVVDLPRPPTQSERQRLPKSQLQAWPAAPKLAVGDYVVVTGTWATQSPFAEHNTDGLLVYKAIKHAVPTAANEPAGAGQALEMEIELDGETMPPLRKVVDETTRNTSIEHLNACNKVIAARQFDTGIAECGQ